MSGKKKRRTWTASEKLRIVLSSLPTNANGDVRHVQFPSKDGPEHDVGGIYRRNVAVKRGASSVEIQRSFRPIGINLRQALKDCPKASKPCQAHFVSQSRCVVKAAGRKSRVWHTKARSYWRTRRMQILPHQFGNNTTPASD